MNKPEILAPAGDLEKLKTAFQYGADACYMGVKSMSMRMKIDDQEGDILEKALKLKTRNSKKLYLTMNIHAHESRLNFLEKELERLAKLHKKGLDPDGILASDVGVIMLVKEKCSWLPIHISTQANTLNSSAIEFWAKQGVTRVVLGREVSLREVKQIRQKLNKKGIDIELEGFVHGAMCMAYSGRCLLSNFMAHRDANKGMCAHSCRWNYKVYHRQPVDFQLTSDQLEVSRKSAGIQLEYYLEEGLRSGEYIPIEEDQHGTSLMSSKDMCMMEHLKDLVDAGLDSLKIEGRHKTVYYHAIASRVYRQALDLAMKGKLPTDEIMELAESINTRGHFTGFWYGKPAAEGQNYTKRNNLPAGRQGYNDHFCFAGIIGKVDGQQVTMEVRNRLDERDQLDIITPEKTIPFTLGRFQNSETGEKIKVAHAGQNFSITFEGPSGMEEGFIVRKRLRTEKLSENRGQKVKIRMKKIKTKIELGCGCKK